MTKASPAKPVAFLWSASQQKAGSAALQAEEGVDAQMFETLYKGGATLGERPADMKMTFATPDQWKQAAGISNRYDPTRPRTAKPSVGPETVPV